jgi:hypothetical protein
LSDTLKALVDVSLDGFRVFGLGQNFEEFLIGKEIESGEVSSFSLKIF